MQILTSDPYVRYGSHYGKLEDLEADVSASHRFWFDRRVMCDGGDMRDYLYLEAGAIGYSIPYLIADN